MYQHTIFQVKSYTREKCNLRDFEFEFEFILLIYKARRSCGHSRIHYQKYITPKFHQELPEKLFVDTWFYGFTREIIYCKFLNIFLIQREKKRLISYEKVLECRLALSQNVQLFRHCWI